MPGDTAARRRDHRTALSRHSAGGGLIRLVLWRHGQTVWNAEHRFQGQTDIALDAVGLTQASRAARLLAALSPDLIVSSDLSRAFTTAEALAGLTGLPVVLDKDLRERYGGSWEGLTDAQIADRYPAERAAWTPPDGESAATVAERVSAALLRVADLLTAPPDPAAPAAEPAGAAAAGAAAAGAAAAVVPAAPAAAPATVSVLPTTAPPVASPAQSGGSAVAETSGDDRRLAVVVGHGAALRLGMCRLLGLPEDAYGVIGSLSNCSWSVLGPWRDRWRLFEHNTGNLPEPVIGDDR